MCGLCGVLRSSEPPPLRRRRVEAMTRALAHRGPDAEAYFEDEDIVLGFRRLAVIDLATGDQPIVMPESGAVIALNGEIYNFRELRGELEGEQRFRTRGDAEVALRLLVSRGMAAVTRLDGMFAVALWQPREKKLYLVRDRFGIKPLYVWQEGDTVAFASEVGALLAGGFPPRRRLDLVSLRHFLDQKYVPPHRSIVAGVRALPPAAVFEVTPEGAKSWVYWRPPAPRAPVHASNPAEDVAERLRAAAARQLVADVPVGVFLSGGVDSSLVTALAQKAAGRPLEAFTVSFADGKGWDEAPAARRAAAHLGCHHHVVTIDPLEVAGDLERLAASLDCPLGDATAIPTWYVSRLARTRVTVTLSGEGADELFGGYARQRWDALADRLGAVGRRSLPGLARLLGRPLSPRGRARLGAPPSLGRYLDWSRVFAPELAREVLAQDGPGEEELEVERTELAAEFHAVAAKDPLAARLLADLRGFLPGDLLPKVDRMSMAHGLEVRVPYLDSELAEYVLSLPGRVRLGLWRDKRLLRRVARRWLPREVAKRRKHGFDVPIGAWLRGTLKESLQSVLSAEAVRARGVFAAPAVVRLVEEHLHGAADHGERLWCLLVAELWLKQVFDRPPEVAV